MKKKLTKKQKDILNAARELFWKHGVTRVTMEEISQAAGVSKMTLYKYYANKPDLALAVLKSEVEKSMDRFRDIMDSNLSFEDKIQQMLILKIEGTKDISREFISDIYQNPKLGLHHYIEEQSKHSIDLFMSFLKDAQNQGFIRKDIKIPFMLNYISQMIQMVSDEQLLSHYNDPQELIMEAMNFMFYGLLPRSK